MKKEKIEIKKLGINGEGIGYLERKVVFVAGALPGETVEVEIVKQTRNFYEAKLLKVLEKSSDRIVEICRNTKECLGCSLLHMKYPLQTQYKKEAIRESIRKYTNYDLSKTVFKDVIGCKQKEGFIDQVNLPIVRFNTRITFGIYQRESKFLTLMTRCGKHQSLINQCLQQLENILNDEGCKLYNDKFKTGLRFLKVRMISNQLQLVFITGKDGLKQEVIDQVSQIESVASIFVSVNTTKHQEFDEVGYSKVYGNTRLEYLIKDLRFLVSVKSVMFLNDEMYRKKHHEICKLLESSSKILSLNCGVGFIELAMDKTFTCIDEKNYHIEDAKLNAKYLKRDNVTFIKGDIDEKVVLQGKKKDFDTILIQNERFGLSDAIKDTIRLSKVKNVIISCDSHSTLAKDLGELEKFYTLEKIVALDTFVYTPYVTTIVKLVRK